MRGTIRARWEDFEVEELPGIEPAGFGDHVHFTIEKKGLTTAAAVRDVARHLGMSHRAIGFAGRKDSRAVARQRLSVEHVPLDRVLAIDLPRVRVLEAARHTKKLRTGQLAGNRFRIRVRDAAGAEASRLEADLGELRARGVPNYFGPQRFGNRGDTAEVGRAVLLGDFEVAASLVAGRPDEGDGPDVLRARTLFAESRYREAASAFPASFRESADLAAAMARYRGDAKRAFQALARRTVTFYVSALQSLIFNDVLARRIDAIDRLLPGDLAWVHATEELFLVSDPEPEAERLRNVELSATGPLFGARMRAPEGKPLRIEAAAVEDSGLPPDIFTAETRYRPRGARRPLRMPLLQPAATAGVDDLGPFLEVRFLLPPGGYATAVLRELFRGGVRVATAADFLADAANGGEDDVEEDEEDEEEDGSDPWRRAGPG